MHTSVVLNVSTLLCSHDHHPPQNSFHRVKRNPYTHEIITPHSPPGPPSPGRLPSIFCVPESHSFKHIPVLCCVDQWGAGQLSEAVQCSQQVQRTGPDSCRSVAPQGLGGLETGTGAGHSRSPFGGDSPNGGRAWGEQGSCTCWKCNLPRLCGAG